MVILTYPLASTIAPSAPAEKDKSLSEPALISALAVIFPLNDNSINFWPKLTLAPISIEPPAEIAKWIAGNGGKGKSNNVRFRLNNVFEKEP